MAERKNKSGGKSGNTNGGSGAARKQYWALRIVSVLVIGALLAASVIFFEDKINGLFGWTQDGGEHAGVVTMGEALNVHFIDVGQGDACVIEFPDGKTALIDAGENKTEVKNAITTYIDTNIRSDGEKIEYIDYVILTHPDSDHCGSMAGVLSEYPAKSFYRPNVLATRAGFSDPGENVLMVPYGSKPTQVYQRAIEAGYKHAENTYVNWWELDPIAPKGVAKSSDEYYSLSFYGPGKTAYGTATVRSDGSQYDDWNNYSPILILEYMGERMALTGDAEEEAQREFAQNAQKGEDKFSIFGEQFSVGVYKSGHHGSHNGTTQELLDAITTSNSIKSLYVIVSCGEGNSYGHPHDQFLKLLRDNGVPDDHILRTDESGSIVMSVRFDEQSQKMRLFYGALAVEGSDFEMRWLYVAIGIFAVALVLILIVPSAARHNPPPSGRSSGGSSGKTSGRSSGQSSGRSSGKSGKSSDKSAKGR